MPDSSKLSGADAEGLGRVVSTVPVYAGITRAGNVAPKDVPTLFHAGPPFRSLGEISRPLMNSLCAAIVFEDWADSREQAKKLVSSGGIHLEPAQDNNMVTPLCGVISPSSAVLRISEKSDPDCSLYAPLNEGNSLATRVGQYSPALVEHLRWLNGDFCEWLDASLEKQFEILPLVRAAIGLGDDCHARTLEGSRLIAGKAPADDRTSSRERRFLEESVAFALNFWMAAAALCLSRANHIEGCTVVTRVGSNGHQTGIQIADRPGTWVTAVAGEPRGKNEEQHLHSRPVGAIGDSGVVDFLGLGGQLVGRSQTTLDAVRSHLPADFATRPGEILGTDFDALGLDHAVVLASACCHAGKGPIVLIGMIDGEGRAGRIGGGVVDVPPRIFCDALLG